MDNKILAVIGVIVVIAVLLFLFVFGTYNGMVASGQNVDAKWANVEAQYQRRVDLIPNLVSTVKGAGNYEAGTLTKLTELRSQWQNQPETRVDTANEIESTLSKLLLVYENYPQLTATQAYRDLLVQLEGTENRISFARQEYNSAVQEYNTRIKSFPGVLVAGLFGFSEKKFFQATTQGAENVPPVNFG